ncbi:BTAD domain-containing putative transcriptional regulator [Actinomadura kijaniata]
MRFGILGPVEARRGDDVIAVGGPRVRALLALLLLDAGRLVPAERLIDGLYGQDPPAGAANALQSQVSRLRRGLGDAGLVEGHAAGYRLAVERDAVDVHRFERLAREGREALSKGAPGQAAALLREALELWRGPAMADLAAPFAAARATRLEEARAAVVEDLAEASLATGRHPEALGALRGLVAEHPLRERARGLLMRALYLDGRQAEALAAYEDARAALAEELGADPSPELAAVHLAVLRGEVAAAPPASVRSHLPAQLTSFVGREEELRRVGALLSEGRLVTLLGPGGAGKTRLAVEAGQREPGEVCFVDLAQVGDGRDLPQAVLGALGLREHGIRDGAPQGDPVERLVSALADRALLIILDNCEHVVADAARLAHRLLSACPALRVLATSREALGITGERLRPLPPLPLPPAGTAAEDVLGYPAVRLFADRAAAVRPDFAVTAGNVGSVLRICGALDGLPLAIELAAARLRSLPVEEVAARLDDRFRLLSRGNRAAAPRHQTLRAVVEWSWDLLDEDERALARRLTVFSGGFTAEAAARVCGLSGFALDDLLAGLVDKSFVQVDGVRYRMLETVRAFGLERLAEAGERERFRRAHAAFFLDLAETADPRLRSAEQLDWLARLAAEHGNLRAALRWAVTADPGTGLRLMAAASWYMWLRGRRGELGGPAAGLLAAVGPVPPEGLAEEYVTCVVNARATGALGADGAAHLRAAETVMATMRGVPRRPGCLVLWAMVNPLPAADDVAERRSHLLMSEDPWLRALDAFSMGYQILFSGETDPAEPLFERATVIFRALGDRWGIANTLDAQAQLAELRGEVERSLTLLAEALELVEELDAREDQSDLLVRRGDLLLRGGDLDAAGRDYERAAGLAARAGAQPKAMTARHGLAEIARLRGDTATARRLYEEVLAAPIAEWGWSGDTPVRAHAGLGWLALAEGDPERARGLFRRAFDGTGGIGGTDGTTVALSGGDTALGMAAVALAEGRPERAAVLLGAERTLRTIGRLLSPDTVRVAAAAREALGDAAYEKAFAQGAAMTREEAADAVLTA